MAVIFCLHIQIDSLLYGRLYLPHSTLEALYLRRLTPRLQLKLSCVSDGRLPNGGSILALLQHDAARYSTEYIYSTDSALLGIRGLYNFGPDPPPRVYPHSSQEARQQAPPPPPHSRFSAGAELYYGLLNKSSGTSLGLRFATLPAHAGFPYTMTLTLNPLMGNLSSTYSVRASRHLALSSRFDFNVYSYESDLMLGLELWRRRRRRKDPAIGGGGDLAWAKKKLGLFSDHDHHHDSSDNGSNAIDSDPDRTTAGVLKARLDQRGTLALRWEGRVKELLYGCGVVVDFKRPEGIIGGVGLEVCYSS